MNSKHRPKLGDIMYSLPYLRRQYLRTGEKQTLLLDPNSPYFPGQEAQWTKIFTELIPIIKEQNYIKDCRIYNKEHIAVDLDKYMVGTTHLKHGDPVSIVENHFIGQGDFILPEDNNQWLTYPKDTIKQIIVSYTGRYVDLSVDYSFLKDLDWGFVGTREEAHMFSNRTGLAVPHLSTPTLSDLTKVINGCDLFVGNQSFPLSLAIGLGKKCKVEVSLQFPNSAVGDNWERL